MENLAKIKQRVIYFVESQKIKKEDFYKKISSNGGNFRGKSLSSELSGDKIAEILAIYPEINPEWLVLGKGNMLKDMSIKPIESIGWAIKPDNKDEQNTEIIASLSDNDEYKKIPFVEQHVVAGFGNADFAITKQDIKSTYVIPKFKNCKVDFMIEISGSSMYPKYNSGDVIACTIIKESNFIQWNKVHVIATKEQGLLVKRIKKSNNINKIIAISDNTDYDPFEITKNEITGIALVVGVIRLE